MKRWPIVCASAAFFLFMFSALAEIQFGDIVRWGLLRHADILPYNATMTYPTGGVIRVVEASPIVDYADCSANVRRLLYYPDGDRSMDWGTGVYHSVGVSRSGGETVCLFTNYWKFVTGRPIWVATFGELSSVVKHALSHRGRAMAKLRPIIRGLLST
jgi:hypothetical protein